MCFGCNELKDMEVQDRSNKIYIKEIIGSQFEKPLVNSFEGEFIEKEPSVTQSELLELINSARLALLANGVFHTPVALRKSGNAEWDEYQIDAINRTRNFLVSTEKFGEVKLEQQ